MRKYITLVERMHSPSFDEFAARWSDYLEADDLEDQYYDGILFINELGNKILYSPVDDPTPFVDGSGKYAPLVWYTEINSDCVLQTRNIDISFVDVYKTIASFVSGKNEILLKREGGSVFIDSILVDNSWVLVGQNLILS